ncbi:universal stress protein [Blastomonas fulva]|jgi:nucleotide-binding universal stress UspA family protein|uniref:universal stress protein n=1 Tax=Blastomonas fulva TaxID=1550728 RepID=UPI003D272840
MKSILLYADGGAAFESRFQVALDLARSQSGHVTFLQATPLSGFIVMDPMGGSYVPASMLEQLRADEDKLRTLVEARMKVEGMPWDWTAYDGDVTQAVISASRLADVIVLSLENTGRNVRPHPLLAIADVAVETRCPVLAVPTDAKSLHTGGKILVAWDGSHEAANALKQALPMLQQAASVHLVSVVEPKKAGGFPSTEASEYLSRHGVRSELIERERGLLAIEEVIENVAAEIGADLLVMGAFGHSRLREVLLGGVTRYFLRDSNIPLLLAH